MSEPVVANLVVRFVDGEGREWLAAGHLGPLCRSEDGEVVDRILPEDTEERQFRIRSVDVVKQ